jgi:hypothetical protein
MQPKGESQVTKTITDQQAAAKAVPRVPAGGRRLGMTVLAGDGAGGRQWAEIVAGRRGSVAFPWRDGQPPSLAQAVRGIQLPRDGTLLGYCPGKVVTALLAFYDDPVTDLEPSWCVMPRRVTLRQGIYAYHQVLAGGVGLPPLSELVAVGDDRVPYFSRPPAGPRRISPAFTSR